MYFDKSKNEEHAGISPLVQKYCFLENWHIFSDIFLRLYSMTTSGADTYAMVTVKSSVVPLRFTSFAWKLYIIFAGFLKFFQV